MANGSSFLTNRFRGSRGLLCRFLIIAALTAVIAFSGCTDAPKGYGLNPDMADNIPGQATLSCEDYAKIKVDNQGNEVTGGPPLSIINDAKCANEIEARKTAITGVATATSGAGDALSGVPGSGSGKIQYDTGKIPYDIEKFQVHYTKAKGEIVPQSLYDELFLGGCGDGKRDLCIAIKVGKGISEFSDSLTLQNGEKSYSILLNKTGATYSKDGWTSNPQDLAGMEFYGDPVNGVLTIHVPKLAEKMWQEGTPYLLLECNKWFDPKLLKS